MTAARARERDDEIARRYSELEALANRIEVGECDRAKDSALCRDAARTLARMASDNQYAIQKALKT